MTEIDQAPGMMAGVKELTERHGRPLSVYTMSHVVCRPTRKEAEDFFHYFAEEYADVDGQAYYRRQRGAKAGTSTGEQISRPFVNRLQRATGKKFDGGYPGAFPLVGTPDDVAAELAQISNAGLAGTSIAFLDYLKEIPYFVAEVLPRLERMGLREPLRQ
jgi:alkanesulfonate monooxygenase SsuD/methylene tetrahydromethanopterin reductase-like flavin-dependent oxidoreductase (luciferase family)